MGLIDELAVTKLRGLRDSESVGPGYLEPYACMSRVKIRTVGTYSTWGTFRNDDDGDHENISHTRRKMLMWNMDGPPFFYFGFSFDLVD